MVNGYSNRLGSFEAEFEKIRTEFQNSDSMRVFDKLKADLGKRPLILYGAGRLTEVIMEYCTERNIVVSGVCDKNITGMFNGLIPIINPQTLKLDFPQAVVVICSMRFNDEICRELKGLGLTEAQIIPYPFKNATIERMCNISNYAWVYGLFDDEPSKQLVLDRLRYSFLGGELKPNTKCNLYYEEGFISFSKNEVYVDGGLSEGGTVESFVEMVKLQGGDYSHIFAFEPNPVGYNLALARLSNYQNVDIVPKGLWSSETELGFMISEYAPGSSSIVSNERKTHTIPVTSLDIFFAGKPELQYPTFIKLDIEGSEKEALLGAAGIIKKAKPKLAICVYHKTEDIYDLPKTLLSIRDDYRLALRQHAYGHYDTVLYAV